MEILTGIAAEAITLLASLPWIIFARTVLFNYRGQIGVMAVRNRLPAIAAAREYAEAGLLLTYGIDLRDQFRARADRYR